MAYRRRDANRYSSADAYRSVHNPGNTNAGPTRDAQILPVLPTSLTKSPSSSSAQRATQSSSSEEETALTARGRSDSPSPPRSDRDESPLSPPRPFFLGNGRKNSRDRSSWSSTGDSLEPASDSDTGAGTESENVAGIGRRDVLQPAGVAAPVATIRRVRSNTAGSSHAQPVTASAMRPRNHHRRRSSETQQVPASPTTSSQSHASPASNSHGTASSPTRSNSNGSSSNSHGNMVGVVGAGTLQSNPFDTPLQTPIVSPSSPKMNINEREKPARGAPPSAFPFLSHAGNPDPGTPIPIGGTLLRRPSHESFRRQSLNYPSQPNTPGYAMSPGANATGYSQLRASIDVPESEEDAGLSKPYAPFMGEGVDPRQSWVSSTPHVNDIYRNSAAAAITGSNTALAGEGANIPRNNSQPQIAMRAPFLSPASRPTSSLWSPPSYPSLPRLDNGSQPLTSQYPPSLTYLPSGSNPYLVPRKSKPPMPSSRLAQKLSEEDKPWIKVKDRRERWSWWLTFIMCWLGVGCSAIVIFFGWTGVHQLTDADLCPVLDEEFNAGSLDSNTWTAANELGGFGNGEFQMTTSDSSNLQIKNGQLYIIPTLTSDGTDLSLPFTVPGCNAQDPNVADDSGAANCTVTSADEIPPVRSARLSTKGKKGIKFGKVEVRAKLPLGDWLWPAIWMLPQDSTYGAWPLSGEIDIMEARGNAQSYSAQGVNFVRSSLNYGPLETLQTNIVGWWQEKRYTYAEGFHTYSLEWTADWMRFYVDSKLQAMMNIKITGKGGKSFFDRAGYPPTAPNITGTEVVVNNIWANNGGSSAAPFDQKFYLILNLAAGGTSGWFPDGVGNKPWLDSSPTAMQDFARNQSVWDSTWPSNVDDRAFRIDYVKMWSLKQDGKCVPQ